MTENTQKRPSTLKNAHDGMRITPEAKHVKLKDDEVLDMTIEVPPIPSLNHSAGNSGEINLNDIMAKLNNMQLSLEGRWEVQRKDIEELKAEISKLKKRICQQNGF